MGVSADQLGKAILGSGLMAPDELKTWWSALPPNQRPKDGPALARLLVEAGKLTQFQAGELLAPSGVPLILGDYVLLRRIGAGGMGQVFQARHKTMDRLVAIKLLPTALTKDAAAIERFRREVKAAAKLLHPNIVAAFDAGEWRQQHYLVMEYVEGKDLAGVASDEGPLAIDRAVNYLRQAAHGLAFAHSKGVIHRDIKPANLLVDRDGVVKILDMGLARIDEPAQVAAQAGLTQSGQVMGTVDYMAPEQALNVKGVDGRADIYSLGCTLYRLLTGRNLYEADTLVGRLMAHQSQPIPDLARQRPDAPRPLVEIFKRMVAKQPDDRFHSMAEVEAALADINTESPAAAQTDAPSGAGSGVRDFLKSLTGKFGVTVSEKEPAVGMAGQPLKAHSPTMSVAHPQALTDPVPEQSVQLARQTVARTGARRRSIALAAGIAAAALAIVLWGVWWMLPAAKSVLKLEITDSETAVAIDDGEAEYHGATKQSIPLVPGNHVLHFFRGGQEWDKLELSLAKGQEIGVTIERSGIYLRVKQNDELVLAKDLNQVQLVAGRGKPVDGETCLEFSGTTGKDEVDLNFPLDATRPFTLEGYFRQTGPPPANAPGFASTLYVWNDVAISSDSGWGLRLSGQKTPTAFEHVLGNKTIERGRWTHVAGVFDGKQARLYVDGKAVQEKDVSPNPPTKSPQTLRMGWKFVGHAKEVRISSSARYDKDFTPAARFTPDNSTLALYHCDEGVGSELKDSSGNNHHGKIVGAKWLSPVVASAALTLKDPAFREWMASVRVLPPEEQIKRVMTKLKELNPQMSDKVYAKKITGNQVSELVIPGNGGNNLAPLQALVDLKTLILNVEQGHELTASLEGLRGMSLARLELHNVRIKDLSPLEGMQLEMLAFSANPAVTDISVLKTLPKLKHVVLDYRAARDEAVLRSLTGLEKINGKPLAEFWKTVPSVASPPVDVRNLSPYDILTSPDYEWTKPENLGPPVNTEDGESSPFETADGLTLLFERSLEGGRHIWSSQRPSRQAAWSAPVQWGPPINLPDSRNKSPTLSADGLTLVFASDRGRTSGSYRLWTAWRKTIGDSWSEPRDLASLRTAGNSYDDDPKLSADGLTLYFHSNRKGEGMEDLFMVRRASLATDWGAPENLGSVVNGASRDLCPFVSSDGRVLVFASDRAGGWGRTDLWYSVRPSPDAAWSPPQTLGPVLNTTAEELCPALSADGKTLYFRSNRPGSLGKNSWPDIWVSRRVLTPAATARAAAGNGFTNSLGMEFVRVPAGKAWLGGGGGKPGSREIEFKQEFELGKFEVTQAQWQTVMGSVPGEYTRTGKEKDRLKELSDAQIARLPVNAVSWNDCQEFLKKLNAQSAERGWKYRLPTCDEWEYACRGGPATKGELHAFGYYFQGPTNALDKDSANYDKTLSRPAPVGSYPSNRLGIHDLHGNLAEWCADPSEQEASLRYLKGGGFQDNAELCTAAARSIGAASDAYAAAGLRLVREPVAPKSSGWQSLSDGVSFKGWTGETDRWYVDPNQITTNPSDSSSHWIFTERAFGDFTLRMQVYCAGKSGVRLDGDSTYLATTLSGGSTVGKSGEFVTKDEKTQKLKFLPAKSQEFRSGESNDWEITRRGSTVTLRINGTMVNEADEKVLPELARLTGPVRIGLESFGGRASFRHIEIREITALPSDLLAAAAPQASALMGTWQIKGRDAAKVDWTGTLVLKEGDQDAGGLTGYIDWSGSDGTRGREHLAVVYNGQSRLLRLTGQRHENSNGLILGKYTAELSADGQKLTKGTWTEGGSDGTWQADRVANPK